MSAKLGLSLLILNYFAMSAQGSRNPALVSTGYRLPSNTITAAPGQRALISLGGLARKPNLPATPLPGPNGYGNEISGFRLRIFPSTGAAPIDPQLTAVQQSDCPASAPTCSPITSITTLFPRDLPVDLTGTLHVLDGLSTVAEFPFRAVTDNLHFLNSCDDTLVWVGLFDSAPNKNACLPDIMQDFRLVNTDNPLKPGAGVAAYLWGGGATILHEDEFKREDTLQNFDVSFDYRPNAPGSRPTPGISLTVKPLLSVGFNSGLYQINFMIPPIPAGLQLPRCDGAKIRSNLTITISGANSMDSASFCIEP
jgi:hypothetical protein